MSAADERTTSRFADKREAILGGAAGLFNRRGIRAGTLAEVAAQVGLATNSLTYYYRRKDDLARACLLRTIAAIDAVVAQAARESRVQAARESRVQARVRVFVERFVGVLCEIAAGRQPELIFFSDIHALPAPAAEGVFAAYTDMFRGVRGLLRDGPVAERIALNARAHLLLSLAMWSRVWLTRYEPSDYPRAAAWLADILLYGLAGPGQGWPAGVGAEVLDTAPGDAATADPRRDAYLRTATRLVNAQGIGGASVGRIAAELALTKGSFYHHHDTKLALIADCFARTFGLIRGAQQAAMAQGGSGWQRMLRATLPLLRLQLSERGPLLRVTTWSALPEAERWQAFTTMNRLGERFSGFIVDGMGDGSIRVIDPTIAAQQVNGLVNALAEIERWVPGIDAENVADLFARPLFLGLLHAPGSGPCRVQTATNGPTSENLLAGRPAGVTSPAPRRRTRRTAR